MNPFDWPKTAFVWAVVGAIGIPIFVVVTIRDTIKSRRKRREGRKGP